MSSSRKLQQLRSSVARLEGKLKKKPKEKKEQLELDLARRRVSTAKSRIQFIKDQSPTTCTAAIAKLEREKLLILSQLEALQSRIAWWENLRMNHADILAQAKVDAKQVEAYRDKMLDPTPEENKQAVMRRIEFLQSVFAGTTATMEDLEKVAE